MTEQHFWDFVAAWERKDVPALMESIAENCVYITTTGPNPGTRYDGKPEIEAAFTSMLAEPDDGSVTTFGPAHLADTWGVLEWSVTEPNSTKIAMRGIDLCEFDGNLITRKDVYRKVVG